MDHFLHKNVSTKAKSLNFLTISASTSKYSLYSCIDAVELHPNLSPVYHKRNLTVGGRTNMDQLLYQKMIRSGFVITFQ